MAEKDDHFVKDEKHNSDDDSTYDDEAPVATGKSGKVVKDEAYYIAQNYYDDKDENGDWGDNTNHYPLEYEVVELRDKRIFPKLKKGSQMP
jgi:hypothetical protein